MMRNRIALGTVAALLWAATASAQGVVTMFSDKATTGTSEECALLGYQRSGLQVTVETATCTGLTLIVEGQIAGTRWAPIAINGGASTITQADVPVSDSRIWTLPVGLRKARVRATVVTSCTFSVYCGPDR